MRTVTYILPLILTTALASCGGDDKETKSDPPKKPPVAEKDSAAPGMPMKGDAGGNPVMAKPDAGGVVVVVDASSPPMGGDAGMLTGDAAAGDAGAVTCGTPVSLGKYTPKGNAEGFAAAGNTVYLAGQAGGLFIADISMPDMPKELGSIDFPIGELAFRVAVSGNHAFVGLRGKGVRTIDVTDPAKPVQVATDVSNDAEDLAASGDELYVINATGIRSYDVKDRTQLVPLGAQIVLPGASKALAVAGSTAYVAALGGGLVTVDISAPAALALLDSAMPSSGGAVGVAVSGSFAYAAHIRDRLSEGTDSVRGSFG